MPGRERKRGAFHFIKHSTIYQSRSSCHEITLSGFGAIFPGSNPSDSVNGVFESTSALTLAGEFSPTDLTGKQSFHKVAISCEFVCFV